MRNRLWIGTLFAIAAACSLAACDRSGTQPQQQQPQSSLSAQTAPGPTESTIVSNHTSGHISKKSNIYTRFVSPIVDETKVGQSADAIFHIQPAIPGSARYSSVREIVFEPAALFSPGTNYQVSIDTNGLLGIPPGTDHYTFGFDIQQQAFEIELGELRTATSQSDATALDGTVTTADYEESGPIEKMLTATYLDSPVTIAWEHSPDGRHHRFFMEDLKRQDEAASLRLQWDGAAIGVASQGKREIAIPPLNKFDVTNIQVVQGPRNYILVTFTDPLDPAQNVDGLVYIRNVSASTSIEGNTVKLYPQQIPAGEVTVNVNQGIRNIRGKRLQQGQSRNITFDQPKPEVRFVGKGVILPDDAHLKVPFEAINVNSVQVTAFEIYPDNIGQFLQSNTLDGSESLGMVGRFLWKKRISLGDVQPNQWQRFAIDTDEFMRSHTGGIIRLTLSINLGNSIYACTAKDTPPAADMQPKSMDSNEQTQSSGWDFAENYNENYYQGWLQRNDPCRNGYYIHSDATHVSRNFLVSNIGLLAKRDQHQNLNIVATDLRSATPLVGAELEVRNFQNQTLARATTDKDGFATVALGAVPFYLVAKKDGQAGYLKLNDATALPTSHFDVGGEKVTGGIKGAVYGERGVWRPGDDIHLTFVLRDPDDAIPANHPVSMELYNPKGQLVQTLTNTQPVGDFYTFTLKTPEDAPTGNWTAKAILGGTTFTKTLKIETVMPNRLKVELDLGDKPLKAKSEFEARLFGQWLHGAKASGLKADVKAELRSVPAHFTRYSDFTFDDPAREFSGSPQTLFEGKLDADGYAKFASELIPGSAPPGELQADFTMRVFEGSGAFSISQISAPVHAYDRYIGIKLPKGDAARNMLLTDTKHTVQIAAVDADGNPVSAKRVQVTLYKIDWKWWWDKSGESLAKYESASLTTALAHSVVEAKDGHGSWDFEIKYPDWGRYLIRACDQDSGHCTGKTLYVDWPGWAGRAQEGSGVSAAMLSLVSDKSDYEVGDTAVIQLPETSQGRALLTVESGSRIIQQRWLEVGQGRSKFELPVTAAMSPNVYVSVALLQPHQDKKNDRPIRLWGVIPIKVHDAKTVLEPVIAAADEWKPRQKVSFDVSEKQGRAMTYTVAVVDEGLLGLTGFRTPELHDEFYRREALGVTTWDLFDDIVGAYGGELERLLALGGSDEAEGGKGKKSKRRFPPVVKFLGAFHLDAGGKGHHEIELPQYLGAVRVMVVAGEHGAYGHADKSIPVREPLGMLATLPRVLSPGEEFSVPVSLFATDPKVKEATVEVAVDDHFEIVGDGKASVTFKEPGEQVATLRLKSLDRPGMATLRFTAKGSGQSTGSDVNIMVRNPNAPTSVQHLHMLKADETWTEHVVPHGLPGTNSVSVEISAVPPLNLDRRLNYLLTYPYGCVEQLTSSAFPQLYLATLVQLSDKQKAEVENHINAAVDRLRQFQAPDGSFQYWPGGHLQSWATSYAGHFLIEARRLGYQIPSAMMNPWMNYQHQAARGWVAGGTDAALDQAYRLYTLALANEAELGAMNRLREQDHLTSSARWLLAASYRLAGQISAADDLVKDDNIEVADRYDMTDPTFGSRLRDQAIILTGLATLNRLDRAQPLVESISASLATDRWYSTQSVAWSLLAMARYAGDSAGKAFAFEQTVGTQAASHIESATPVYRAQLDSFLDQGSDVSFRNSAGRTLYATITTRGIPQAGSEEASSKGLKLSIDFTDLDGHSVDIEHLEQGSDIVAEVEIMNRTERDMENLALNFAVPSGWEIHHARYTAQGDTPPDLDYQDVRDDRILSYFGLKAGKRITLKFQLNAAYLGRFYMPATLVEAMYDAETHALRPGEWVEVGKPGE